MFERTLRIIKQETYEKIKAANILLIGVGGVGGYALECLVRSGFENITIVDGDEVDITNLNRQIISLENNVGLRKVFVAKERAIFIRSDIEIKTIDKMLQKEDITEEFLSPYDYIIDACDTVDVKVKLLEIVNRLNKKCISSMGTANRLHPEDLMITTLNKTHTDPLAKKIRYELRNNKETLKNPVIWSKEIPVKSKELGTICSVPMSAGALLCSYIINDIEKEG